jgi:hypothetical protein
MLLLTLLWMYSNLRITVLPYYMLIGAAQRLALEGLSHLMAASTTPTGIVRRNQFSVSLASQRSAHSVSLVGMGLRR